VSGVEVGIAALRAALLLAALLAFFHAVPTGGGAPRAHGRELVAQYELPADLLERYRERLASNAQPRRTTATWADPTQWFGPQHSAGVGRNPYTLVLSVHGVAKAGGDVRTHWQAGWEVQESHNATRDLLMPLAALSSGRVEAGTPLTLTAVGTPVSFRGDRRAAPMLSLVDAQNIEIRAVKLAIWSGAAPWAWGAWSAPQTALLLMGLLLVGAWFMLRQQAPRATPRPAAAPTSTLPASTTTLVPDAAVPEVDLQALLEHRPRDLPVLDDVIQLAPAPSPPNHAARVVAALRDVLTVGLAVPSELDATRKRRRRRREMPAG
jgi:hypothetical protein